MDKLLCHYTDIPKIHDTIKTPSHPNKPLKWLLIKLKMRESFPFVQNLDVTYIVSSQIQESLTKNSMISMISMDNITPTTLINPHLHSLGHGLDRWRAFLLFFREYHICQYCHTWWLHLILQHRFFHHITKHAQATIVMSQISETYQTIQSSLKSVMQELQSNRHHLNYSAMQSSPIFIMNGFHMFTM